MQFYKNVLLLCFIVASIANPIQSQNKVNTFELKGNYKGADGDKIYIAFADVNQLQVKDSSIVKDNSFLFKGNIDQPTLAYLYSLPPSSGKSITIFLEPSNMQINLDGKDWKKATITGSSSQKELDLFNNSTMAILKEMEPLSTRYDSANKAYIKAMKSHMAEDELEVMKNRTNAIHDEFEPFQERIKRVHLAFFINHPTSIVTAYNLRNYVNSLSADSLEAYYSHLGSAIQQTNYGKSLAVEIGKLKSGSPGSMAKSFITTDIKGQSFNLVDLKGKYVLLDFWASWCVPCRKGNPHLKELYAHYKTKGFEIVGVSDDDRDNAAWKKAVEKDGLPWIQVLRGLKYDPTRLQTSATVLVSILYQHKS